MYEKFNGTQIEKVLLGLGIHVPNEVGYIFIGNESGAD
jgi:hypothetical protein